MGGVKVHTKAARTTGKSGAPGTRKCEVERIGNKEFTPKMRAALAGVLWNLGIERQDIEKPTRNLVEQVATKFNEVAAWRGMPIATSTRLRTELQKIFTEGKGAYVDGVSAEVPKITGPIKNAIINYARRGDSAKDIARTVSRRFGKDITVLDVQVALGEIEKKESHLLQRQPKNIWTEAETDFIRVVSKKNRNAAPEELAAIFNSKIAKDGEEVTGDDVERLLQTISRKARKKPEPTEEVAGWNEYVEEYLGAVVGEHKNLKGRLGALAMFINADECNECEVLVTEAMVSAALIDLGIYEDFMSGMSAEGKPDDDSELDIGDGRKPKARGRPKNGGKTVPWKKISGLVAALEDMTLKGMPPGETAKRLNEDFKGQLDGAKITARKVVAARSNYGIEIPN